MIKSLLRRSEQWLFARGFTAPLVRHLLRTQVFLAGGSLTAGLLLAPLTLWPLMFGCGAAIALYNFWYIARFAQANIRQRFSSLMAMRLVGGFSFRLLATGCVLFTLIVWLRAPVVPLLAGLTSLVAGIALWGFSRLPRKPVKEA